MSLLQADADCADAVMIGDSWGDVQGAQLAGIACIGVTYGDGDTTRLLAAGPDYSVDNVTQLAGLLIGEQA